tara:strand:- start:803 stop:1237 length:435 start_codon:yes stop_codon:yes gene_type:complete
MNYEVGNILWVVGHSRPGLKVLRVVEEVTKKNLNGTLVTYQVEQLSSSGKSKIISIDNIEGEIFSSAEEAKEYMKSSAEKAINKMISLSQDLIQTHWKKSPNINPNTEIVKTTSPPSENSKEENYEYVELENGTRARIQLPPDF